MALLRSPDIAAAAANCVDIDTNAVVRVLSVFARTQRLPGDRLCDHKTLRVPHATQQQQHEQ